MLSANDAAPLAGKKKGVKRSFNILLVCAEGCDEVEKRLLASGCWVVKVREGRAAVARSERQSFDAAVLVSTGRDMDLAETVFNLRDINPSMEIIIAAEQEGGTQSAIASEIIAQATPGTRVFGMSELENYLGSSKKFSVQRRVP